MLIMTPPLPTIPVADRRRDRPKIAVHRDREADNARHERPPFREDNEARDDASQGPPPIPQQAHASNPILAETEAALLALLSES